MAGFLVKKTWGKYYRLLSGSTTKPSQFELLNLDIDMYYNDILDFNKLEKTVCDIKPEIVFHLAAHLLCAILQKSRETFETNVIVHLTCLKPAETVNQSRL
jgi:FlaA1/EpsC-like NDP-sugar epimerase